jgi:hypothetical protein
MRGSAFFIAFSLICVPAARAAIGHSVTHGSSRSGRAMRVSQPTDTNSGRGGLITRRIPENARYAEVARGIRFARRPEGRARTGAEVQAAALHELWNLLTPLTYAVAREAHGRADFTAWEKRVLARIARLARRTPPRLRVVSGKAFPTTDVTGTDAPHRIAWTREEPGAPILVNGDHLREIAERDGTLTRAQLLEYLGLLFFHEMGHKLGIRDTADRPLDALAAKVVDLTLGQGLSEISLASAAHPGARALLWNQAGTRASRLFYIDGAHFVDLTPSLVAYGKSAFAYPATDDLESLHVTNARLHESRAGETSLAFDARVTKGFDPDTRKRQGWDGHFVVRVRTDEQGAPRAGREPGTLDIAVEGYERAPSPGDSSLELSLVDAAARGLRAGDKLRFRAELKPDPSFAHVLPATFHAMIVARETQPMPGAEPTQFVLAPVKAEPGEAGTWALDFEFDVPVNTREATYEIQSVRFADEQASRAQDSEGPISLGSVEVAPRELVRLAVHAGASPAVVPRLAEQGMLAGGQVELTPDFHAPFVLPTRLGDHVPELVFKVEGLPRAPLRTMLVGRAVTGDALGKDTAPGFELVLDGSRGQHEAPSPVVEHQWGDIDGATYLIVRLDPSEDRWPTMGLPLGWRFDELVVIDENHHRHRWPISLELRYPRHAAGPIALPGALLDFVGRQDLGSPLGWLEP